MVKIVPLFLIPSIFFIFFLNVKNMTLKNDKYFSNRLDNNTPKIGSNENTNVPNNVDSMSRIEVEVKSSVDKKTR